MAIFLQLITSKSFIKLHNLTKTNRHRSRAMAVASAHSYLAILSLRSAHDIAEEIEVCTPSHANSFRPPSFNPTLEVRVVA